MGKRTIETFELGKDPHLTQAGVDACKKLATTLTPFLKSVAEKHKILIAASPFRRTIETAAYAFGNLQEIVLHRMLRETHSFSETAVSPTRGAHFLGLALSGSLLVARHLAPNPPLKLQHNSTSKKKTMLPVRVKQFVFGCQRAPRFSHASFCAQAARILPLSQKCTQKSL